ncbi:DUF1003 domain-containing protein [Gryllotalpicola sp.]|uniref:DUF1003 domain-containing protein n=1 Tax=Gryllotalpicola sp. TaxID=1932787 RepID=UPI0026089D00|nr:DUF1003 domain-containing protein [Gryllotalpicola sp.]
MSASTPAAPAAPSVQQHRRYGLTPRRFLKVADPTTTHPAVIAQAQHRAASIQLRIADAITAFAGSMMFVYIHIVLFVMWMLFLEHSPWPTLTLVVSLEAIFLSTFVMVGQNRQAAFQQAKADRDYQEQETLLVENTDLTRIIHELSREIRDRVLAEVTAHVAAEQAKQTPPAAES